MADTSFAEQVATFNGVLQEIESRVATGEVGREAVADFKSSVDDLRLRLWSILGTGSANDYRAFQERFRLRRAKDVEDLEDDLQAGVLSPRHEEMGPLVRRREAWRVGSRPWPGHDPAPRCRRPVPARGDRGCGQAPGQAAPRVAAGDVVPVYREPMYDGPTPLVIYESDWR